MESPTTLSSSARGVLGFFLPAAGQWPPPRSVLRGHLFFEAKTTTGAEAAGAIAASSRAATTGAVSTRVEVEAATEPLRIASQAAPPPRRPRRDFARREAVSMVAQRAERAAAECRGQNRRTAPVVRAASLCTCLAASPWRRRSL